jgi:uncharacterized protein (DUF697 family)
MELLRDFWGRLRERVLAPKADAEQIDRHLRAAREKLPTPVFWLLGKAQAGKTSIIRGITGAPRAEIGNGFRPCTRTAQLYAFPGEADCLVKFLDTRGLGEVGYDPAEDLRYSAEQAHLLMVVIKAMDHAHGSVLDAVRAARQAQPQWPMIVVQTSLHEGYSVGMSHIEPYPFASLPYPSSVPADLARSLATQREAFAEFEPRFVPVDFTQHGDGFEPEHYGIEALWDAIEVELPLGLRGILEDRDDLRGPFRDAYYRAAHPHVIAYSLAAGAAAAFPVPFVDVPLVLGVQGKLFHTIASIYGQRMTAKFWAEISGTLGMGILARLGRRELAKLIPGVGIAAASLYSAASTYALGSALCAYFSYVRAGDVPDAERIRELYAAELAEGRRKLGEYLSKLRSSKS